MPFAGRQIGALANADLARAPCEHALERLLVRRSSCHTGWVNCAYRPVVTPNPRLPPTIRTSTSVFRIGNRQRANRHRINELKDRGVGADAERKRHHGHGT